MVLSPAVSDPDARGKYLAQADRTAAAIDQHCYNKETGHYNITHARTTGFQQEAHAWLILQDLIPQARLPKILDDKFPALRTGSHNNAPLSFTAETPGVPPVISPIMSAFHAQAAIHAGRHAEAEHVLRTVWAPMANESSPHFTGTTWEFLRGEDGTPFKGDFCSYAQLFSVGPTYLLSRYVLGVEPLAPGYKRYLVSPRLRIGGLKWAQGRVPTPAGEVITVRWEESNGAWRLSCQGPRGFDGTVMVPAEVWERKTSVLVNGTAYGDDREIIVGDEGSVDINVYF
jgi:hypothetical protein